MNAPAVDSTISGSDVSSRSLGIHSGEYVTNAVSTYAASTPHEFFATTFNCYIHDRICFKNYITDATKDGMPTTWGYFETMEAQNWM